MDYVKVFVFSSLLGLIPTLVWADPVVIIGDHNVRSATGAIDDRPSQKKDVCESIKAAEGLGNPVYLFIPTLVCGGKTYTGRCPDNGCSPGKLRGLFQELGGKLPTGKKQNLVIQTIGHGGPHNPFGFTKNGPEYNDLVIQGNPQVELTAVDFAEILKGSGVLGKVKSVKGLVTQCYGGGWHELAGLIAPPGKFCSLSQTRHDIPAVNVDKEIDALGGSAFTQGFWRSQAKTKGKSSLSEAGLSAGELMRELTTAEPYTTDWRTSSIYLTEKLTTTGEFSPEKNNYPKGTQPPYAYFTDGLDPFRENPVLEAFIKGTDGVDRETDGVRSRYRAAVSKVSSYNSDKWFWQDSKEIPGSYLLKADVCPKIMNGEIGSGFNQLGNSIRQVQNMLDQNDYGKNEGDVRKQIDEFQTRLSGEKTRLAEEVSRYWKEKNALLEQSGELVRKISANHDWEVGKKLGEEYDALEEKFRKQDALVNFPTVLDAVLISKKVHGLQKMLSLMNRSEMSAKRDLLMATWACENDPVFIGTGS